MREAGAQWGMGERGALLRCRDDGSAVSPPRATRLYVCAAAEHVQVGAEPRTEVQLNTGLVGSTAAP